MENSKSTCAIAFSSEIDTKWASFGFFTRQIGSLQLPKKSCSVSLDLREQIIELKLEGSPFEIQKITDNQTDEYVIVRGCRGSVNFDNGKKSPNGSVRLDGFLGREEKKIIEFKLDLATGRGKITRIR